LILKNGLQKTIPVDRGAKNAGVENVASECMCGKRESSRLWSFDV